MTMTMTSNLDLFVSFCDKIERGELDKNLSELSRVVQERKELLKEKVKIDDFVVGDRITINERCGTKYLRGEIGSVVGIRRTKVTVRFDNPKGRFARTNSVGQVISADVIVPLEILDKL